MKQLSDKVQPALRQRVLSSSIREALGDYWWATSLLGAVVLTAEIGFAAKGVNDLITADQRKPAYTLKLVSHGEGMPKAENLSGTKMQQNRRVDVAIRGVVVDVSGEAESTPSTGNIWLTQDPLSVERKLNITTAERVAVADDASEIMVRMDIRSNYASYIDSWKVLFYRADDTELTKHVASVTGDQFANESVLEWNGILNDGEIIEPGDEFVYVLQVADAEGNIDETYPASLSVLGPDRHLTDLNDSSVAQRAAEALKANSKLARAEIPIRGSRIRIHGRDLGDVQSITINGDAITTDSTGDFATEYLREFGTHQFTVEITDSNGQTYQQNLSADLKSEYMFMVALADITAGKNQLRGISTLAAGDQDRFNGDIFVDGRLAFYLKGKVKGKYLLTAQMDTGSEDIDEIFNGLSRKDNTSVFRRLDPEQYYPVYGDDSTIIDDTDSQGKLYVRVEWDHSRALWGNFNTGITGTELAQFNRSLYGAQVNTRSGSFTENGDHKTDFTAFVSEAQSAARHVEFKGTGGSLYYLRDTDIVQGSEKLWVEVRQRESGRVLDRIVLVEGRDYQIDDLQGRIILNKPLRTVGDQQAPSIIKDTPLDGNELWLVADYEYVPDSLSADQLTAGVRGKHWFSDNLAIGATWVLEQRTGSDHEIKGIDATLAAGPGSWVRAEFAQSESSQTAGSFRSDDGGLNFEAFSSNDPNQQVSGDAYSIEAKIDLSEKLDLQHKAVLNAWGKYREKGFSSAGIDTGTETTDAGIEASFAVNDNLELSGRVTALDKKSVSSRNTASIEAQYKYSDGVSLAAEIRQIEEEVAGSKGSGTIAALQAGIDITDEINLYGSVQKTIESSGTYESNDLLTLGVKTTQSGALGYRAEASAGDRGESLLAGVDYKVNDKYSVYLNQRVSTDTTQTSSNTTTIGQRHNYNSKLRLFTEHQFSDDDRQAGLGHTFGLNYKASEHTNIDASVQAADLESEDGTDINRDVLSLGLGYQRDKTRLSSRMEYRRDKGESRDAEQWLLANSMNYIMNPSLRMQGKLNFSETQDKINSDSDARFAEAGIGFAYRPVSNSRMNMLARLTRKVDLPPLSQADAVEEKSVIGSMEMAYQVNRLWEAGGKLALKKAETRADRQAGQWADNDAVLVSSRLRYHLRFKWDALAEYHWLQSEAAQDMNHGAMLSLGRHVGDNLKLAVGYNFTEFDDSLLNNDSDVKGWFLNLVGKY